MLNRSIHTAAILFVSGLVYSCQLEPFVSLREEESSSTDNEESFEQDTNLPAASSSTTSLPEDTDDQSASNTTDDSSDSSPPASSEEQSQNDSNGNDSENDSDDESSLDSETGPPDPTSTSETESGDSKTNSSDEGEQDESELETSEEDEGDSNNDNDDVKCEAAVVYTFDSGPEGWHTGTANPQSSGNSWEWGFENQLNEFVWATSLNDFCLTNESSYVASPVFSLAGCQNSQISLIIHHWYAFSDAIDYPPGDGGIIEISLDGGKTWEWIEAKGHEYCSTPIQSSLLPVRNKLGFCKFLQDSNFYESRIDLSQYAERQESQVAIRFVVGTDYEFRELGWYINQVEIKVD